MVKGLLRFTVVCVCMLAPTPPLFGQSLMSDVIWSRGGHKGEIQAVILSPDETLVASASADRTIKLWRFSDSALVTTLTGHSNWINSIAFSSDGQFLVSGSSDRTIRVWRVSDGSLVRTWTDGPESITSISLSPDSRWVATSSGSPGWPHTPYAAVRIWDLTNGDPIQTLTNNAAYSSCVAFSPDGQMVSACVDGVILNWNTDDWTLRWAANIASWSTTITFSPDSQNLAFGGGAGWSHLGVRRSSDGLLLWQTNAHSGHLNGLAFSEDRSLLVSVGSRNDYNAGAETKYPSIILWNPADGSRIGIVPTPSASVNSVALTRSGASLVTGEINSLGATHTFIRLWQTNGLLGRDWSGHSGAITAAAFSPDGDITTSGGDSFDRAVRLWDAGNGVLLHKLEGHAGAVRAIAFSPDGTKVAYGDDWSTSYIRLFRVSDGGLEWSQSVYPHTVSSIAFSPEGAALAIGHGTFSYSISLRNVTDGLVFQTITGLTNSILALAFPASNQVVSLTQDAFVKFWQTNGILSRSINVKPGLSCGAFSSDGGFLAVGYTNREVELVRLSDGAVQKLFPGHSSSVKKVALSADGEMLLSAAEDELMLWRVSDGALLSSYKDEVLSPASLTASPRGDAFAFGRSDATLLVLKKPDFLLPPIKAENGSLFLRFSGVSGANYLIETSTELETWLPWTNVFCSGPAGSLSVPISGSTNRFYRLTR